MCVSIWLSFVSVVNNVWNGHNKNFADYDRRKMMRASIYVLDAAIQWRTYNTWFGVGYMSSDHVLYLERGSGDCTWPCGCKDLIRGSYTAAGCADNWTTGLSRAIVPHSPFHNLIGTHGVVYILTTKLGYMVYTVYTRRCSM